MVNLLQVATVKKEPVTPQSCLFTGQSKQKCFADLFLLHVSSSILEAWTVICLMESACLLVYLLFWHPSLLLPPSVHPFSLLCFFSYLFRKLCPFLFSPLILSHQDIWIMVVFV